MNKKIINSNKRAFTLAEVLITLMVIGILAMVTLPSLVQTLEKNTLKSQIKRELSILEEALKLTLLDDDYICFYKYENGVNKGAVYSECTKFFDNFYSKLKVVKTCKGNALIDGCIPQYSGLVESLTGCPEFSKNKVNTVNDARVLADGAVILSYNMGTYKSPLIAVDVNGIKPPNIQGRDVIVVKIAKDIKIGRDSFIIDGNIHVCATAFGSAADRYFNTLQDLYK